MRSTKAFTLIETLIAMVIGVISVAAISYSYIYFNNTYQNILDRANMSQSGRSSLHQISKDLRNAGFKDVHYTKKNWDRWIEKKENYEGALKDLEIYVYENPQNANGWNLIGFASRKLGKFEDAELYYNTGLEIEPQHDDILAYQGELYLQTNRYEKALENLAILSDICVFNCTEKKELAEAVKKYELENNL